MGTRRPPPTLPQIFPMFVIEFCMYSISWGTKEDLNRVLSYLIADLCVDPVDVLVNEPDHLPGELLAQL
jgi:hypothetical protein